MPFVAASSSTSVADGLTNDLNKRDATTNANGVQDADYYFETEAHRAEVDGSNPVTITPAKQLPIDE